MSAAALTRRDLCAYGLLAMPLAFAGMPLYMYMPDYYVRTFGLGLSAAGFTLLVAGMAAILHGPPVAGIAAIWFTGAMAVAACGLSVLSINMAMIGGFWHAASSARLRIATWRECFTLAGMIVAVSLPVILQSQMAEDESFKAQFWIFAVCALMAGMLFRRFWRVHGVTVSGGGPLESWSLLGGHRAFLAVCLLTHLAAALPAALFLFFVRDYLRLPDEAGLFLLLYLGSGIAGMPVWQRLATRYGMARVWMGSMAMAVSAFAMVLFLQAGQDTMFALICLLSGAALGADLAMPPAMMAARLAARAQQSGGSRMFAVMNMIPKIALGIASGGALLILGAVGYRAGAPDNAPAILGMLAVLYAGVPCFLKICAALLLHRTTANRNEGESYENPERSPDNGRYHVT